MGAQCWNYGGIYTGGIGMFPLDHWLNMVIQFSFNKYILNTYYTIPRTWDFSANNSILVRGDN